jgi:hypothetical protein
MNILRLAGQMKAIAMALLMMGVSASMVTVASAQADAAQAEVNEWVSALNTALRAGDFDGARGLCQKAIAKQPKESSHYIRLATIEAGAKKNKEALDALQRAGELGSTDMNAVMDNPAMAAVRADPRFTDIAYRFAQNAINELQRKAGLAPAPAPGAVPVPVPPPAPAAPQAPLPPPVPSAPPVPVPPPVPPPPSPPLPPPAPQAPPVPVPPKAP